MFQTDIKIFDYSNFFFLSCFFFLLNSQYKSKKLICLYNKPLTILTLVSKIIKKFLMLHIELRFIRKHFYERFV